MSKSKVAVLYTKPETILQDYQRLFELAGGRDALDAQKTTILKDNITWYFPMPGANTIPWQLEGSITCGGRSFITWINIARLPVVKGDIPVLFFIIMLFQ